jgi:hypothetical protein
VQVNAREIRISPTKIKITRITPVRGKSSQTFGHLGQIVVAHIDLRPSREAAIEASDRELDQIMIPPDDLELDTAAQSAPLSSSAFMSQSSQ